MKRELLVKSGISALVMLGLPWLAVTFAPADAGMAICFLLFYAVDPVYAIVDGYSAGKHIRYMWSMPIVTAVLFLLGTWLFFDMGEILFLIYALVYLALETCAMILSAWRVGRK